MTVMKKTGYIQASQAWYSERALEGKDNYDEFLFSVRNDDGTLTGEFSIEFMDFSEFAGKKTFAARLRCYDEAMVALTRCLDIVYGLADGAGWWTPESFRRLLDSLPAYEDVTPTTRGQTAVPVKIDLDRRSRLVSMISALANEIDWSQTDATMASIGLFVKDGDFFVAMMGAGMPDTNMNKAIGAQMFGVSTVRVGDTMSEHKETADMLLCGAHGFFEALE